MLQIEQYRPPGRSNRSGRAQADNDVFEGLPVKQWGHSFAHVSLAPPKADNVSGEDDKWGEPPMPRDYQLLQPWTQQLLRLARSGKVGTKRKPDPDSMDDDKPEDEIAEEAQAGFEDRDYVTRKWKPVPEAMLEPEHKHFEFLAKRRKGLPSLYGPEIQNGRTVHMRKTKVQKAAADGEVALYEVLVPEGQTVEGEVTAATTTVDLDSLKTLAPAPGTVVEGVGIANEDGVLVAEHLKPTVAAPRRNRPPPKKKGGPGRGKKRVTFTNPDGSTYTTVVPNATKIVPQPGQTVKHVAKGEEPTADVTAEQAAAHTQTPHEHGEGDEGEEGEDGDDDEGDEGDDDDDREEGELSEEDAPTAGVTPVPPEKHDGADAAAAAASAKPIKAEDVKMEDSAPGSEEPKGRDASSSPELPLAKTSHSRQNSLVEPPTISIEADTTVAPTTEHSAADAGEVIDQGDDKHGEMSTEEPEVAKFEDGEEDLLGNLERSLAGGSQGEAQDA